jgi:hypothetical protein
LTVRATRLAGFLAVWAMAYFRHFLKYRSSPNCGTIFPTAKMSCNNFDKKWVGLHFGRIFNNSSGRPAWTRFVKGKCYRYKSMTWTTGNVKTQKNDKKVLKNLKKSKQKTECISKKTKRKIGFEKKSGICSGHCFRITPSKFLSVIIGMPRCFHAQLKRTVH